MNIVPWGLVVTASEEHGVHSAKFWAPGRAERLLEECCGGCSANVR